MRDYVCACPSCHRQSVHPSKPTGLLQPLDVPAFAWHTVTTDPITGLPTTPNGNSAIAVCVHKLTKYAYAVPCKDFLLLLTGLTCILSMLSSMRGFSLLSSLTEAPQFTSTFNRFLALRLGIIWNLVVLTLVVRLSVQTGLLRMSCVTLCHLMIDWDLHLCTAQFAMDNAWHETIQQTPSFLNHGRAPKTLLDNIIPHRPVLDNPISCTFAWRLQQIVAKAR